MKLKKILKESTPGFNNRKFGDGLPTLDSVQKAYQAKQGKNLNEEYIEIMPGMEEGLEQIVEGWAKWKSGPMTEKGDIAPARKELLNYCVAFLKKHVK